MVDTLPWKSLNVKDGGRNVMEDSTDTLVDDGNKVIFFVFNCFKDPSILLNAVTMSSTDFNDGVGNFSALQER